MCPRRMVRSFRHWCAKPAQQTDPDTRRHRRLSLPAGSLIPPREARGAVSVLWGVPIRRGRTSEIIMEVLLNRCAALDVHKADVYVCRITPDEAGNPQIQERKFATFTTDLLALRDWLTEGGVTHVAMESTADYWCPIYNVLEG